MREVEAETPAEPRAFLAIERASVAFARAFPYLVWRYGDPGLHDLRNDNALLLATATTHPCDLCEQLRWIADQMSLRGQPRWMLEIDIELLARTLPGMLPEHGPGLAATLRDATEGLARERHSIMAEGKFRRVATAFADDLGCSGAARLWRGFGQILCATVIDERWGHEGAVDRMRSWALDPRRFGPRWIAAVETTLRRAHQT